MSDSRLPIRLQYNYGVPDLLVLQRLTHRPTYRRERARNAVFTAWMAMILLIAATAARRAGDEGLLVVLALFLVVVLSQFRYKHRYWRAIAQSLELRTDVRVELQIDEEGLREKAHGIESFAPWSAVSSFAVLSAGIFISLANQLWSVIPAQALANSQMSVEDLAALLDDKGVPRFHEPPDVRWWRLEV